MFPFWLIAGGLVLLMGIFNKQMLRFLGLRPMSEIFTTPSLKRSSRIVEQMGRWLVISLGLSFLVQGLGAALPTGISHIMSTLLLGLSALLLIAMFGVAIANWKAK